MPEASGAKTLIDQDAASGCPVRRCHASRAIPTSSSVRIAYAPIGDPSDEIRSSSLLAHLFDERDLGVKRLIQMVIAAAYKKGRRVGICRQAPSDYPEFAECLARLGIDSISLNPDSLAKVAMRITTGPAEC